MKEMLLEFVRHDCAAASWALCSGDSALAGKLLARAEEFLGLVNARRGAEPWRTVVPRCGLQPAVPVLQKKG
jgi:hypothetical protein